MGSSDSDRSLRRDQGLHGCSSCFSINIDEVLEPSRRRTRSSTRAQDQAPQPMNVDEDQWKFTPEGFSLRTNLKEQRYNSCQNRITSNFDLDFDFLGRLDFAPSIEKAFKHLGWSNFIHISATY